MRTKKRKTESQKAVVDAMVEALVRLEEKLLALRTLDDFDREILAVIAPALNMVREVRKSHSADLEVQS